MDVVMTVAYRDVRLGDRLYNKYGYCECAKWVPVTGIRVNKFNAHEVLLDTAVFGDIGHEREGVLVKRTLESLDAKVEDTMPRNVRNFWIEADIDGRGTEIAAGPRAKDGGFTLRVYMRNDGEVERVLTVQGRAMGDGHLSLMAWDDSREGSEVTVVRRKR